MEFPKMSDSVMLKKLAVPEGKIDMVLDTDTYNEVDDQFALMYALRSTESVNVKAIYAAPFFNDRSTSPKDGMMKSYAEIFRVLDKMDHKESEGFVFQGSDRYLDCMETPCDNDAIRDLISKAKAAQNTLYVVAIGAATNVASAILTSPDIIKKISVIWLGGHAHYWHHTKEFNLSQDIVAARVLFDSGVPLIQVPCFPVASHLITTVAELERHMDGKSSIGSYLTEIVRNYSKDYYAWSKAIWDITAVAYLINPSWVLTQIVHSPILTDQLRWSFDNSRHFIKTAISVDRDKIFADMFKKV